MNAFHFPGRRSRRSSEDVGNVVNVQGPPQIPHDEIYDPRVDEAPREDDENEDESGNSTVVPQVRARASTISNGHAAGRRRLAAQNSIVAAATAARNRHRVKRENKLVPTVFKLSGNHYRIIECGIDEPKVYISGTMTDWKSVAMTKPKGENDFMTIIDCPEGQVVYKFCIEGSWEHDSKYPIKKIDKSTWNEIRVRRSDLDVFEALACDSFALKDNRYASQSSGGALLTDEDREKTNEWTQVKPPENFMTSAKNRGPPILPPHLLQVLLNKDGPSECADPVMLPEPSLVTLDHLYAQSIRDGMLVMSTTHRYRKKFVTMVLYRPI